MYVHRSLNRDVSPGEEMAKFNWYSTGSALYRSSVLHEQSAKLAESRARLYSQWQSVEDMWPRSARLRFVYVTKFKESGETYLVYRHRHVVRHIPALAQPPKVLYGSTLTAMSNPTLLTEEGKPEPINARLGRYRMPPAERDLALVDNPDIRQATMLVMPHRMPMAALERTALEVETAEAVKEFESTRLSPTFHRWFEGAADYVRNEDGTPKVFYRGQTGGNGQLQSRRVLDSFTDSSEIASMYAANATTLEFEGSVLPVYIDVKNPLVLPYGNMSLFDFIGRLGYWQDSSIFDEYDSPQRITHEEVLKILNYLVNRKKAEHGLLRNPKISKAFAGMSSYDYALYGSGEDNDYYDEDDEDDDEDSEYWKPGFSLSKLSIHQFRDDWEGEYNDEELKKMAMTLVVNTFALVETPMTKTVLKRLGYDGVVHMDHFTASSAAEALLDKPLEDVEGIEANDDYEMEEDLEEVDFEYGHWTLRPLDRSQVWPIMSEKPYQEPARVAAMKLSAAAGDGITKEVVRVTKRYEDRGYELRDELWTMDGREGEPGFDPLPIKTAYSLTGDYIGGPEDAHALWKKFGICQWEKRTPESVVCSIGYSPTKKQWFGWSHRACSGFKSKEQAKKFAKSVANVTP